MIDFDLVNSVIWFLRFLSYRLLMYLFPTSFCDLNFIFPGTKSDKPVEFDVSNTLAVVHSLDILS